MKRRLCLPLIGYFIGWLYCKTLLGPWPVLIFVAAFFAWGIVAGWEKQKRGSMHSLWAVVTALIGLAITANRCHATADWSTLALHVSAGLWALSYLGAGRGGEDALGFALDCADAFLLLPFGNFFGRITDTVSEFSGLFKPQNREAGKKRRRDFWLAVLCLVLALPLLALVTNLLGEADAGFESLIQGFRLHLRMPENFVNEFFFFVLGLPVGAYLYGLLRGAARRQETRSVSRERLEKIRVVPASGANLVLGLFVAVYFLFFGVQAGNLFAVFSGRVPGMLTAAGYARSGFFQLCAVMAINFFLIWLLSLFANQNRAGKWLMGLLMVQSIFLAVTAGAKLWLYISRFGFTPLRLLSAWGIIVLTVGCILTLRTLATGKKSFHLWLYFAAGSFTALCFY